ncbi:hypothetical protein THAOC_15619 [Thalassiosira oceanica]|uniref:RanBD1 domain-containing protein n=1 Tax=Thalassiosira oceanica TaxID=159749 RepID=K0SEH6_THAOC|nr:hypothetical protein THAOC_15619 [Thalassiosira oceanica]|eukprot:EJK63710.1 hypothetical protein THAOC_15619 [Thalassiosira oceanica]
MLYVLLHLTDDYDPDDRFAETPDPGQGMTKADASVLQKRRILKVGSRAKKYGAPVATFGGGPSVSISASNPFGSTVLRACNPPPAASTGGTNPFGSVKLATSVGQTQAKPTFSFGGSASATTSASSSATASAPAASASTASSTFGVKTTPASAPSANKFLTTPRGYNGSKVKELTSEFLALISNTFQSGACATDYSPIMQEYLERVRKIEEGDDEQGAVSYEGGGDNKPTGNGISNANTSSSNSTTFSFGKGQAPSASTISAAPAFSFGGSAASAPTKTAAFSVGTKATETSAAKPFASFGAAPASSGTTFSFTGSGKTAPPATTPKSAFSFGAAPSVVGTSANAAAANEDDPTSNPDDGKINVGTEVNTEDDILYELKKTSLQKKIGEEWKRISGTMRIYRNKANAKCKLVIRDDSGKVLFNVALSQGMGFQKNLRKTKKGIQIGQLVFMAVEDAEKGVQRFSLLVAPSSLDELHSKLSDFQ